MPKTNQAKPALCAECLALFAIGGYLFRGHKRREDGVTYTLKGGQCTMRSQGMLPYDAYLLRKLPHGRYVYVEITSREDLALFKEHVAGRYQRVHIHDLQRLFPAVRARQAGTHLTVADFLRRIGIIQDPKPERRG